MVSHLLVGPAGIFALLPYNQPGVIEYNPERNRWKQTGGNFFLKTFGGESLGRPDLDAKYASGDMSKEFLKIGVDLGNYKPQSVIVFTNPKAVVKIDESPVPAITHEKLKEFIRKQVKVNLLPPDKLLEIKQKLGE